jgi:hypothetical protein
MPRINFVSFTFLFAFGLGAFAGIGLALLAVALATPEPEPTVIQPAPAAAADVPPPTSTPTPTPTATVTATPEPVIRTRATLNVHIGPAESYAILGTLAGGSEIDVSGRDSEGDWVAIEFPPNSAARGWIPAEQVDGLSFVQILGLEVLQATLIETAPRFPFSTPRSSFDGGGAASTPGFSGTLPPLLGTPDDPTPRSTPRPATPTPPIGPTDLAIAGVELVSGNRIRVSVENVGPGSVPGVTVEVRAPGYSTEALTSGSLRAGQTLVLQTAELQLNAPAPVTVEVDPDGQLADLDRSNNVLRLELAPQE